VSSVAPRVLREVWPLRKAKSMVLSTISAVTVAPAVAASLPPWWCFVILALPHLWYMCVRRSGPTPHGHSPKECAETDALSRPRLRARPQPLLSCSLAADTRLFTRWVLLHPSSTKRTASLFKMDAVEWFSGIAVALNVAQFVAVFTFVFTCGRFTVAQLMAAWSAQPWRVVALPLAALGLVFKVSIFNAIGKKGVYYGAKFGHSIPWVHGFPFSVTGAYSSRAGDSREPAAIEGGTWPGGFDGPGHSTRPCAQHGCTGHEPRGAAVRSRC